MLGESSRKEMRSLMRQKKTRSDGTLLSKSASGSRRQANRRRNAAAKLARKANR